MDPLRHQRAIKERLDVEKNRIDLLVRDAYVAGHKDALEKFCEKWLLWAKGKGVSKAKWIEMMEKDLVAAYKKYQEEPNE